MSLLRRIERGNQSGGNQPSAPGGSGSGSDEQSRLDSIRRQRVQVPLAGQGPATKEGYVDLKARVQTKLLSELDPSMDTRSPEVRSTIEELFTTILAEENIVLSRAEKTRLFGS